MTCLFFLFAMEGDKMRCLLQSSIHTRVDRGPGGLLDAQTVRLEGGSEWTAALVLDARTLCIRNACLENFCPPTSETAVPVPELVGVKAYLDGAAALKSALKGLDSRVAALFLETVRGVVQAETYLLQERGFESAAEYSSYFENIYAGSCRYYSYLDRVRRRWDEYAGGSERKGRLFWRSKTYLLYALAGGGNLVIGSLADTFHELNVRLWVDGGRISTATADFLRIPDTVCSEAAGFLEDITGMDALSLNKKELAGMLGGSQGCIHLIDVVDDAVGLLKLQDWNGRSGHIV